MSNYLIFGKIVNLLGQLFLYFWRNCHSSKWPNIDQTLQPSGHTAFFAWLTHWVKRPTDRMTVSVKNQYTVSIATFYSETFWRFDVPVVAVVDVFTTIVVVVAIVVSIVAIVVNAVVDVDFGAVKQLPPRLFFMLQLFCHFLRTLPITVNSVNIVVAHW